MWTRVHRRGTSANVETLRTWLRSSVSLTRDSSHEVVVPHSQSVRKVESHGEVQGRSENRVSLNWNVVFSPKGVGFAGTNILHSSTAERDAIGNPILVIFCSRSGTA